MFFLSWRQMMSRKNQTFLILLGISFGTLLFISISGVQLGFRQYITEQLLNNTAHILISGEEKNIIEDEVRSRLFPKEFVHWLSPPSGLREEVKLENHALWYHRLNNDSRVLDFSPRLQIRVIALKGKFTESFNLIGTVPEKHLKITSIKNYMRSGRFEDLSVGNNNLVIGSGIAKNLGVKLNQYVQLSTGKNNSKPFKIVGILHFGNKEIDDVIAFADLDDVQVLAKTPGKVTEITVSLLNIDEASQIADDWAIYGKDKIQDWQEANEMFMEMIKVQDFTRFFITISVLIVAAFGIYNVLSIMINQKKKEIAILRAIGFPPLKIFKLFLYQGLTLGISGGILGMILGYLLCRWFGSVDFNFEIGGSNHLLISYDYWIYITAFVAANISAMVASMIPAYLASKFTPIEILRSQ
jgi:lipoprotein-releasing system permease protein